MEKAIFPGYFHGSKEFFFPWPTLVGLTTLFSHLAVCHRVSGERCRPHRLPEPGLPCVRAFSSHDIDLTLCLQNLWDPWLSGTQTAFFFFLRTLSFTFV